jgi:large subunit ribosomal protein L15
MNLSDVKSVPFPRKRSFRVGRGRGSGWGKTSRRGHKGAASRTGWGGGIMREGGQMPLARRLPKKGFNNKEFRVPYEVVNVDRLSSVARDGQVTPEVLKEAGLIKKSARWVKVLGDGEPGGALKVSAHHFSRGAREKIEKAGGTVTVLPGRHGRLAPVSLGERHAASATAENERRAKAAAEAAKAPKKKGKDEEGGEPKAADAAAPEKKKKPATEAKDGGKKPEGRKGPEGGKSEKKKPEGKKPEGKKSEGPKA